MTFYRGTIFGHMQQAEEFNMTFHVRDVGGQAATIAADAGTAVTDMWSGSHSPSGNLVAYYSADLGVDGVRIDELDASGHNVAQFIQGLSLVGTSTDELLPPNVAVRCSFRTGEPTHRGHGGFYLPSPVVTTAVAQRLDTTVQTNMKNAGLAFVNSMNAAGHQVVIYHHVRFEPPDTGTDVTDVDVGDVFDSQRRRRNQLPETRVRSAVT
jgi:hypothetical protein